MEVGGRSSTWKSSRWITFKASTAPLLMLRDTLWFLEVEAIVPPYMREQKNIHGQTPYELFFEEHKHIFSEVLKWMKDCMVVALLITAVAFAVRLSFTVPGGYNQENGITIFIHDRTFLVYVIANAFSLFSSSTSLLVFSSILTSHHDQHDFLYSLPKKLMIGLSTLFISVGAMLISFSASFFVLYHTGLKWVPFLFASIATMLIIVFAILQFPLWLDMFRSMYMFKPKKA